LQRKKESIANGESDEKEESTRRIIDLSTTNSRYDFRPAGD
jgi:hypothetical protein